MAVWPQYSMHALVIFWLLFTETTSNSTPDTWQHGGCLATERAALLTFKAGITSYPENLLSSWQGQDCCRWRGVGCSNRSGHVVKLNLRRPTYNSSLQGEISSSLLALEHLQHLDLSDNYLLNGPGGHLPEFLGSLKNLRYLNLSLLKFSGPVPPQLGNLSKLAYLDLSLSFYMQSADLSWLQHLSLLKHLDMSYVDLGSIGDWDQVVNMLPSLRVLRLSLCGLNSTTTYVSKSNLTKLEILDLSDNSFAMPSTTNWFWDATSLKYLDLSSNNLHGPFADRLGNLTSLQVLRLNDNQFKGMMPATLMNLCNFKILDLGWNDVGGDITEFIERLPKCSWSKFQVLRLAHNNMIGSLPNWLSQMTRLSTLDLSFNKLTGPVPTGIGALANLTYLNLRYNRMDGLITKDHFAKLTSLEELHLSANSLAMELNSDWIPPFRLSSADFRSCRLGPEFPAWLKWQMNISLLDISNTSIAAPMPDWFWVIFSKVDHLYLSQNHISGTLPATLGQMAVSILDLSSNEFTGSVSQLPQDIWTLDLSRNSFSGPLPSNLSSSLEELFLCDNYFTGTIPASICQLQYLRVLDLGNNLLTGRFPRCSEDDASRPSMTSPNSNSSIIDSSSSMSVNMMSIRTLRLDKNSLSDEFPSFLQNCPELQFLDLGQNKFSGCLPVWIGEKLAQLEFLRLRSNMFSGYIPTQLAGLRQLQYLDLACNNFSGTIPRSLLNLEGMTQTPNVTDWDNPSSSPLRGDSIGILLDSIDSIFVVTKGQEREHIGHYIYMVSLDLSCNNLTGEIPKEIGSVARLVNLNLSWNHLSGNIPDNIGSIRSLESLDLSNNELFGEIPSSLSDLTFLCYLNLSYNNLSGRIPSGHQLDTLSPDDPSSMYIGNSGLCGSPLQNNCSGNETTTQGHLRGNGGGSEPVFFYLGLIVGFLVGLWMVFCAMLFQKTWRIAYFRLCDELYDKTYVFLVVIRARWFRKAPTN